MRLKELFRIKAQPYEARKALVLALNECGYATKIVEHKYPSSATSNYWVAVFEEEAQVDPSERTTMPPRFVAHQESGWVAATEPAMATLMRRSEG